MAGDETTTADAPEDERIPDARPRATPLWAWLSRVLLALEAWLRSHGGRGLRNGLRAFWGVVAAAGMLLLIGPVINPPLSLDDLIDSAGTATDTWIAREFDADYTLSRDDDGRLRAEVVETITATFPDDVDESGIRRTLLAQYEGHELKPVLGETTIDGRPAEPAVDVNSDTLEVTLDTGERLSGDHVFTIAYTMQDFAFTSTDEASGQAVDLIDWSVFGPDWPHAFTGLDVSISLPEQLDEQLVRQPRGSLAWTLVSGGGWLTAEDDAAPGTVEYGFTNDQNIPPNAQAWFTMPFPAGTFTMPPPSRLFLVQSFGPLVPLAVLLVTLLFTLAARAVAWSDARGRPWFVAQSDPPAGVSPQLAAQVLERPRARELAVALARLGPAGEDRARRSSRWRRRKARAAAAAAAGQSPIARAEPSAKRRAELIEAGRAANRAGRLGDRLRAFSAYLVAPERREQYTEGLRRIPRGFVRDFFLLAPIALTLAQWGIVRQLSHQVTVAVVWWPAAFVLLSTAISLVIVAIALSARPLTEEGARLKQYLRGIGVYAERTQLLSRSTLGDRLLPYAVLLDDPRDAGARVRELVVTELGDDEPIRRWRTPDFWSRPRILVTVLSVAVVAAAIVAVATVPNPYARDSSLGWDFDTRGELYTQVESASLAAELSRDADRRGVLEVTSRFDVTFEEDSPRVPQFAQRLPTEIDGQSLGLEVHSVRVDGDEVPYTVTETRGGLAEVGTTMSRVLTGAHVVELDYALTSAVVAGSASPLAASGARSDGGVVDRMRWAALLEGWDSGWAYPSAPDPLSVSFTVSDELAASALAAGWLREDPDSAERARDWADSVYPWGTAERELGPPEYADEVDTEYPEIEETTTSADGSTTHRLVDGDSEMGYATDGTYSDLGVMMEFPRGTFAGPDEGALQAARFTSVLPILVVAGLALLVLLIAVVATGVVLRRGRRRFGPGTARDVVWRLGPALALAAIILFGWATGDMPSDWPEFPPLALSAAVAAVAATYACILVRPLRVSRLRR